MTGSLGNWEQIFTLSEKKLIFKNMEFLKSVLNEGKRIGPSIGRIFAALSIQPSEVKVCICGQDPYHTDNVANGYAFAVNETASIPPSLRNIFRELQDDIGEYRTDRTLQQWVNQGVLLLNNTLSVEVGKANSHLNLNWYKITNRILRFLSEQDRALVFILWGAHAKEKKEILTFNQKHLIIESNHPSPMSANRGGFFGTKPFSRCNDFLIANGVSPILW